MERLFIHSENQTLLWNVIQQTTYWETFSRDCKIQKEMWFRKCIEKQYTHICNDTSPTLGISKQEWLLQQNKEAIRIMMKEIADTCKPTDTSPRPNGVNNTGIVPPFTKDKMYSTMEDTPTLVYSSTRNYDIPPISAFDMEQERKTKFEKAKIEFENYQSQYNRLLQPLTPPSPEFSENMAQPKIANMEELLIIQQKMRETDYDMFSPPPPPPTSSSTDKNDREKIKIEVGEVIDQKITNSTAFRNTNDILGEPETKRSVSWSPALF